MSLPENDYQILKLIDDFYNTYPNPPYIEIHNSGNIYIIKSAIFALLN